MLIIDLDDFRSDCKVGTLLALKKAIPNFKVTLFTIPGLCTTDFLDVWKRETWCSLVPHGLMHPHPRECQEWSYEWSCNYLSGIEPLGLERGFKAPGWQISDGMYQALLERGYWVADQTYNNERRPAALPVYLLDHPSKIHGHLGHLGGHNANELQLILPQIMDHAGEEFGFVKDNLQKGGD